MRKPSVLSLLLALTACSTFAWAQQPRVGLVATVVGAATVARGAGQAPLRLRFRDDVFLHDRIATGDRSFLRVLLGDKATVTARERSVLTITEAPAVSTIGLTVGRIAVAVSKDKMKTGDAIEIRLPNALAVIRGTVVIAEVSPTGVGVRATVTILRGVVEVRRLDPASGQPVGATVRVGALERITVTGSGPLSAPERVTAEAATRLYGQFTVIPRDPLSAGREAATSVAADLARLDALQLGSSAANVGVGTGGAVSATVGPTNVGVPGVILPGGASSLSAPDGVPLLGGAPPIAAPGGVPLPGIAPPIAVPGGVPLPGIAPPIAVPGGGPLVGGAPSLPKSPLPKLP